VAQDAGLGPGGGMNVVQQQSRIPNLGVSSLGCFSICLACVPSNTT
jgi:hypothetical protein